MPQEVLPDMVEFIKTLRERITIGVVGGSDLPKQKEQLGDSGTYRYSSSTRVLVGSSCSVSFPGVLPSYLYRIV